MTERTSRPDLRIFADPGGMLSRRVWPILSKTASALVGRKIKVRSGIAPSIQATEDPACLDLIYLPPSFVKHPLLLRAVLEHESLHARYTENLALRGVSYAVHLCANALEDPRLELGQRERFTGTEQDTRHVLLALGGRSPIRDVQPLQACLKRFDASGEQHSALASVVKALYVLLRIEDASQLALRVVGQQEAVSLAEYLLPEARRALTMKETSEVVGLAEQLLERLNQEIQKRRDQTQDPEASHFYATASRQLRHASSIKASEVLTIRERWIDEQGNRWRGPWFRGGPHSFPQQAWDVEEADTGRELQSALPSASTLMRWLVQADPCAREDERHRCHQPYGRLMRDVGMLIRATTGKHRYVFRQRDDSPRLILPAVLRQADYHVLIESHMKHPEDRFDSIKLLAACFVRLFNLMRLRVDVAGWCATIPEVIELNARGREIRRVAEEGAVHVAAFGQGMPWAQDEARFLSLPSMGFNLPIEFRYPTSSGQSGSGKRRLRIVLSFGDLGWLNVRLGDLKGFHDHYRKRGARFTYFNTGGAPTTDVERQYRAEVIAPIFDGVVDLEDELRPAVIEGLQRLFLIVMEHTQKVEDEDM